MEDIPSDAARISSNQFWARGYGPQVHHRLDLQRLHL